MISIVYVYYNSADVIFNSINSILNSRIEAEFEIIIIINKCTDIKISQLEEYSSKIKVVVNEKNLGFGTANNVGVRQANGNYILVLNPDTVLQKNVLQEMYTFMEKNVEIGASICKLLNEDGSFQGTVIRKKVDYFYLISQLFILFKFPIIKKYIKNKYYYSQEDFFKIQYPDAISGAFMLIRKDIYNKVNGFDENIFMYMEDIDLSMRIKQISKICYNPNVSVNHIGDTSLGDDFVKDKIIMNYTSMFYFINKFYGKHKLILFKILLFINGILFLPFAFLIKKNKTKNEIVNRSKVFLNLFDRKFYNA